LQNFSNAYAQVDNYNQTFLGIPYPDWFIAWDPFVPMAFEVAGGKGAPDQVAFAARQMLDGIRSRAESDLAGLPATDSPLDPTMANQVAFDLASMEHISKLTVEILPQTSTEDLVDSEAETAKKALKKVGDEVRHLLPSRPWIFAAMVGVGLVVGVLIARRIR